MRPRAMTEAERIAGLLPRDKGGTLRFWGQWFGRPYDNYHRVVTCEVVGDALTATRTGGARLTTDPNEPAVRFYLA